MAGLINRTWLLRAVVLGAWTAAGVGAASWAAGPGAPVVRAPEEETEPGTTEGGGSEEKDANDVRNVLDNLGLVRDLKKATKPTRGGLWQKLIDMPYYTPMIKAQKHLFHGQYRQAEGLFKALLAEGKLDAKEKAQAEEGRLASILRQGLLSDVARFEKGVEALPEAQRNTLNMTMLRAEAMLVTGRLAEAQKLLKPVVDETKLQPAAGAAAALYNKYGEVLEQMGQYPAAAEIYTKVAALALEALPDDPVVRTEVALAIYRSGELSGAGKDRYKDVLTRLGRVLEIDRTYWPAHEVMARVLLANHNVKEGGDEAGATLDLNPNNIAVRMLALNWAIDSYNFEQGSAQLEELKDISDYAEVGAMEGRLLLKQRVPEKAVTPLEAAVKKNPQLARARGWLASAYWLNNNPQKADAELSAVKLPDGTPHPEALFEAGEVLRDARQFGEAEKLYNQAAKAAEWWGEPYAALGELYMETGQEDKAKEAIDKSFKIAPFNLRGYNQLTLLDYLEKFQIKKTDHFVIKYDPADEILAEMAAAYLEKIYPEVTGFFKAEPAVKTSIELFPSHEQFGVRTTGLPWIGTVGACTGNVIAMDVPRGGAKGLMGAFDWARVMRHEYTHTVTLAMTGNRIPHWLTEAAACSQEEAPRDWENCQLLFSNYRAGTLFKLEDLTWGFIRPKRSIDRQLAYMQSQWVWEYLVETYGQPKILDFLRCFKDGMTEQQAFAATYQKSPETMNKEFLAWAGKQIEAWGLPSDKLPKLEDARKTVKDKPDDVEAKFTLASVLIGGGQGAEAKKLLEEVVKADPKHVKAKEMLGAVLNSMKKTKDAAKLLEEVVKEDPKRPVALRTLGLIAMQEKRFDDAEKWFVQFQQVRPLEDTSYTNLAGIYLLRKEPKKAIAQLQELQRHEQKDQRIARKLAELLRQEKQLREAEAMAYKALRIDPYNAVNHQMMAQILLDADQAKRAVEYWQYATELQPKVAVFWEGLAESQGRSGDAAGAAKSAQKAVELQPNNPAKKWIKE